MQTVAWRDQPLRAWLGAGLAALAALAVGVLLFPRRVWDEFLWQYLWGPVVADAHAVGTSGCAVRRDGHVEFYQSAQECAAAVGIVAQPGYTPVSTGVYIVVLLYALVGIVLLVGRYDLEFDRAGFFALVPWVFFGGALRVVEDANARLLTTAGEMLIGMPWAGFIISPLIYFVVFALAISALLVAKSLEDRGTVDTYAVPLAAIGTAFLLATLGILGYFFVTAEIMEFNLLVPVITLGGATLITWGVWELTERYWPAVNEGTGLMGAVIIWGHAVDGIANVLSLDWWHVVGLSGGYAPKHVVNRGIINFATAVQPQAVSDAIGTAWPFLPLKVGVAVVVVWVFNDEVFEDNPMFAMLLLIAVFAVGLGPGTRDFLRATLGI